MPLEFRNVARRWLPLAAVSTALCLLVYLAVQQSQRSALNDPQVQMAEDAVRALERGDALEMVIPSAKVEIEHSLAPFILVYDAQGRPIGGSGLLRGQLPSPPSGVFEFVRANGEERVSWQPERGVRIASVVRRSSAKAAGFVLAGRLMREVEKREHYTEVVCIGAIVALAVGSLIVIVASELALGPRR